MLERFINSPEVRERIKEAIIEELIKDDDFKQALKRLLQ